jgi:hypothetical protein
MTNVVIGQVITADGMARQSYLHTPPLQRAGEFSIAGVQPPPVPRTRYFALNALETRTVQRSYIPIDINHDEVVGHVEHLEPCGDGAGGSRLTRATRGGWFTQSRAAVASQRSVAERMRPTKPGVAISQSKSVAGIACRRAVFAIAAAAERIGVGGSRT